MSKRKQKPPTTTPHPLEKERPNLTLIVAIIAAIATIAAAIIAYAGNVKQVLLPIEATQTAEARLWTATPTVTPGPTSTSTPTATPTALPTKIIRQKDKMTMLLVIGNTFQMGSIYGEEYSLGDEYPIHDVQLDTYWIDEHEVTNGQYKLCVQDNYCSMPMENTVNGKVYFEETEYDNYPVVNVTWEQAKMFCEWAEASLPTEAQWEYSARGTKRVVFPWGNSEPNDELANYSSDSPKPVEFYPKGVSWVGAFDMAGNVFEWVNDWYDGNYYSVSPVQNPPGSTTENVTKVMRGGSWRYDVQTLRTANRNSNHPLSYFDNVGFRCARNLSQ